MTTLVERLRKGWGHLSSDDVFEAADAIERLTAANKVISKMAEPAFVEMKQRLDANINWPRYLPVQLVGPTAVSGWTVRLPSGREIGLTDDEWTAALTAAKRGE